MPTLIRPVGMLREYIGGREEVEVASGQTAREMLAALRIAPTAHAQALAQAHTLPGEQRAHLLQARARLQLSPQARGALLVRQPHWRVQTARCHVIHPQRAAALASVE